MTFIFRRANVVDRDPPPPGSIVTATFVGVARATGSATGRVTLKSYPAVPTDFRADPDVLSLWHRYEGYKNGREPLAAMAYFCLTTIEVRYGGRRDASMALSVDPAVLNKLGELSTNRGDLATARKKTADLRPFAVEEASWLETAIRALIRRIGEIASGHSPSPLTMNHLPQL